MKARLPRTLPWPGSPPELAEDLRHELRQQLTTLAGNALWALLPVILLTVSGLWWDLDHGLLLAWGGLALLQTAAGYYNNRRNRDWLARRDSGNGFLRRNTLYYIGVACVWGLLPLFAALWGSERAAWFSLLILLVIMTALVLILSSSHHIFHGALLPSGLLMLASLWLGPVYSPQLFLLGSIYLVALALMHNLLFQVQLERVQSALQSAATVSELAHTLEHRDPLTRLYNLAGLREWLQLHQHGGRYSTANLVLVVVKGLSDINELYGSSTADTLLRQLAERLMANADEHMAIARLGGAEFVLLDLAPDPAPERLGQMLATLEHEPFDLAGHRVDVSLQQASVQAPVHELDDMIETARNRLQLQRSSPVDDESLPRRRELVTGFHQALAEGRIQPWFQPITDCHSGAILGWEALVRWEHPVLGVLPPDAFLDIARISGQAAVLTRSTCRAGADFLQQLMQAGCTGAAQLSINFTAADLVSDSTINWLQELLAARRLQASQITIELPEKEALLQDPQFSANLLAMRKAGMQLAIDDFGTGYANLGHLLDLPATTLKIDQRFVSKLPADKRSIALVRAMLTMAQSMDMQTVAEGVERQEQLEFLRANGCEACQGFLGGNPMPAEEALRFACERLKGPSTTPTG